MTSRCLVAHVKSSSIVVRLPHLVLKLELQLEDGVLLRERLPPALPLKYRGQVVVAVLVVLGSKLKEKVNNLEDKKGRGTFIEDNDRCLVCTGGADDLRMFTGLAKTWGITQH